METDMVQTKVRSIDGDGHVIEDTRRLLEHMEAPYRTWYAVRMYASDWPHWDGDYPHSLFEMRQRKDLTEEQRHGVLCRAAARFYGLRKA
jgi:hypothetical protein